MQIYNPFVFFFRRERGLPGVGLAFLELCAVRKHGGKGGINIHDHED